MLTYQSIKLHGAKHKHTQYQGAIIKSNGNATRVVFEKLQIIILNETECKISPLLNIVQ